MVYGKCEEKRDGGKKSEEQEIMTWCNNDNKSDEQRNESATSPPPSNNKAGVVAKRPPVFRTCPSCGHEFEIQDQTGIQELPGLPAGVKFDPTDQELLEHLEGKVRPDARKLHRLIDQFIPTLQGENGICYTHPEKLPGVSKNGMIRHFFHRPSKAYTTGNRKRRKVHTDEEGGETRWHKTGKTRPVFMKGELKGYKKILVLYTNYGKQRKPEKTNWVMHQYHLGNNEEEKEGELVVSKVFYQTQPRQCGSLMKDSSSLKLNGPSGHENANLKNNPALVEYYNSSYISFDQGSQNRASSQHQMIPRHFAVHGGSSFVS